MVALETPQAIIGAKAADFTLPAVDGKTYSLAQIKGPKGFLIVFICNHCPYVQKQLDRMVKLADELKGIGMGMVAINSNDAVRYPDDSFDNMKKLAKEKQFNFPYLFDESQQVARAYGAVCTPDFYGYNAAGELQYRGRMDSAWSGIIPNPDRELFLAMQEVAQTGRTTRPQNPSIGCSIKWKKGA